MKQSVSAALALMLSAAPIAGAVMAAENVSDAEPAFVRGQQSSGDTSSSSSSRSDAMSLLYQQISELREEILTLRSMVEEQAYEIRRLRQRGDERYRDLDSRISALYQEGTGGQPSGSGGQADNQSASGSQPSDSGQQADAGSDSATAAASSQPADRGGGQGPVSSAGSDSSDSDRAAGGSGTGSMPDPSQVSEQELYQYALDRLLQDQAYEQSIEGFDLYLENYPEGEFVTNAHYWKGQAYVNLSQPESARAEFATIVNEYPEGRKVDDAMYSLGTVLHQLGNEERARELLEQVMSRFPNTSAANLADIYLRSL